MVGLRTTASLRVLVCAESFLPAVNGVTNSVLRLLSHLDRRGHTAMVVAPGPGPAAVELDNGRRVPVARVRSARLPRYRTLPVGLVSERRIRALMSEYRPDIVHLAAPAVLGNTASFAAKRLGVRSIAVFQTDLPGFLGAYGLIGAAKPMWSWLRRLHNRSAVTLAPTPTVAHRLRARGFDRVDVWGRGVDHQQFTPTRRSDEL